MKKLLTIISCFILLLFLFGCDDNINDKEDDINYPEGSIKLTINNIDEYFDIKVQTVLSNGYIYDEQVTYANAYVTFIPKKDYVTVYGTVRYEVNSRVTSLGLSFGQKIVIGEQELLLHEGITNTSYKMTFQTDYSYTVKPDTSNLTLKKVSGYVIEGDLDNSNEYEKLTEEDRLNSSAIKGELVQKVSEYENTFNEAKNYNYCHINDYRFKSIFGEERDEYNSNAYSTGANVDVENKLYQNGLHKYFYRNGKIWEQRKNSYDLVIEKESWVTEEHISLTMTPHFVDMFDPNAIYIKDGNNYYGYVMFSNIGIDSIKDHYNSIFINHNILEHLDKYVVKYSYLFSGDDFKFEAKVSYFDIHSKTDYYDNYISYGFNVKNLNKVKIDLYTPDKDLYALEDNFKDAKEYLTGLVEIDSNTTEVEFSVFQEDDSTLPYDEDNYLPIRIKEGGLYDFKLSSGKDFQLFDENNYQISGQYYYPEGLYFLRYYDVPYGKTDEILKVRVTKLNDYADLENPIAIKDNKLDVCLESVKDKQAFSYTPTTTGLYEFCDTEYNISIKTYLQGEFDSYIDMCTKPYLTVFLEAGKEYVFTICYYTTDEDGKIEFTLNLNSLGNPSNEIATITDEWSNIYLGNGNFTCYMEVDKLGYYKIDIQNYTGITDHDGYFESVDDSSLKVKNFELADGTKVSLLKPGKYYFTFDTLDRYYLKGDIRYNMVVLGVDEDQNTNLSYEEYTSITAYLPTYDSKLRVHFTISETSNLLYRYDSSSIVILYDLEGNKISADNMNFSDVFNNNVRCYRWLDIEAGSYYIELINQDKNGIAKTITKDFRLQKSDEHPLQFYYSLAYPEYKATNVIIRNDYKTYFAYHAAIIDIKDNDNIDSAWSEKVGEYEFKYSDSNRILVYYEGNFMSLSEFVNNNDLADISLNATLNYWYTQHVAAYSHLYEN